MSKSVCIIGGSIAGCGAALALIKNPIYQVKILERIPQRLSGQGAGIFLPTPLFESLKQRQYLDADFKSFPITHRHFVIRDPENFNSGRTVWEQSLSAVAVHWNPLFENLRKRIPDEIYFSGCEVSQIDCSQSDQCVVSLTNGETMTADLVICADGYASIGRKLVCPEAKVVNAGYHAWRGVVPFAKIENPQPLLRSVPYFVNEKGHLLCYPIWEGEQLWLNWLFYENCDDEIVKQFFIDKFDHSHQNSVLPGMLSAKSKRHLYDYAGQALPQNMADIVMMTEKPFIQRILDCYMTTYRNRFVISLGDGATLLRPHVGAGAGKALKDALCLEGCLNNPAYSLDQALNLWNAQQIADSQDLYALSQAMGEALVVNPPDWRAMDEKKMLAWWQRIVGEKRWYPEKPNLKR